MTLVLTLLLTTLFAAPLELRGDEAEDRSERRATTLREPPVLRPTADVLSWRPVAAHLDRENLDDAVAILADRIRERERDGIFAAPFFAAELARRAAEAAPALSERLFKMARVVAPGSAEVELLALADSQRRSGRLRAAVGSGAGWRTAWQSPTHGVALRSVLFTSALWGALLAALIAVAGLLLRHLRAIGHDLGTSLPPWLRGGGAPLALCVSVLVITGAFAGPVVAAILGVVALGAHLQVLERVALALAFGAVAGLAVLAPPTGGAVADPVDDDVAACAGGGCDPAAMARLVHASGRDQRARAVRVLDAVRAGELQTAIELSAVPATHPGLAVAHSIAVLADARLKCGGRDVAPSELKERLVGPLKKLAAFPEDLAATYNRGVLAMFAGRPDEAIRARSDARLMDGDTVEAEIARGRHNRKAAGDDEIARELCGSGITAFGQLMPPTLSARPERVVLAPPGLGPVPPSSLPWMGLGVALWVVLSGVATRGWRLAARCLNCGWLFSSRRHLELSGLTECERCLHHRVVGVLSGPGDRWKLSRDHADRVRLGLRARQLWSLVLPGAGALFAGRPLLGWIAALSSWTGAALWLISHQSFAGRPASLLGLLEPAGVLLVFLGVLALLFAAALPPVADPPPRLIAAPDPEAQKPKDAGSKAATGKGERK